MDENLNENLAKNNSFFISKKLYNLRKKTLIPYLAFN